MDLGFIIFALCAIVTLVIGAVASVDHRYDLAFCAAFFASVITATAGALPDATCHNVTYAVER